MSINKRKTTMKQSNWPNFVVAMSQLTIVKFPVQSSMPSH